MDRNEELLTRFEREYMAVNSITAERRTAQLKLLHKFADTLGQKNLDEMTAADLRTFLGREIEGGYHPNTVLKHLFMVRAFVTWAHEAELIDVVRATQLRSVDRPRGSAAKATPRPYKASEVMQLKAMLADKYPLLPEYGKGSRAMRNFMNGRVPRLQRHLWRHARRLQFEAQLALALECGLRRVEIHRLTVAAMHYDNDEVVVLTAKQGPGLEVTRHIPYPGHARACVQEWLDFRLLLRPRHDAPWLQLSLYDGAAIESQIAPQTFRAFRGSLTEAFGVGWEWHRLRHTAATEWLRSGVPIEQVCTFMGHSNLEQTRQYTQILNSDISAAFGRAEASFAERLGLAA